MEIKITENLVLTTDSPASSCGIPALRHLDCDCCDHGPGDPVPKCLADEYPAQVRNEADGTWQRGVYANMAEFLCVNIDLEGSIDYDAESLAAIKAWLAQLPGGPKLAALE